MADVHGLGEILGSLYHIRWKHDIKITARIGILAFHLSHHQKPIQKRHISVCPPHSPL